MTPTVQQTFNLPPLKEMQFSDGELRDFSEAFATIVLSPNTYISNISNKSQYVLAK